MTQAEKKAAARRIAAEKKQAETMVPTIVLQYQGIDVDIVGLIDQAKAAFKQEKKRTRILSLELYLKPEEHAAYYVVNGSYDGKIEY